MTEQQTPQPSQQPQKTDLLPAVPALPFTMKADLTEYRKRLGVGRIILAFAISLLFLRFGVLVWALSTIGVILIIVAILVITAKRTITATQEAIEYTGFFGKKDHVAFSDIRSAKIFYQFVESSFGTVPRMIIGRLNGKNPISLTALHWKVEEMDQLAAILQDKKVAIEAYEGLMFSQSLVKEFPEYTTYIEKHPFKIAFIIVGIILVVASAFILLTR